MLRRDAETRSAARYRDARVILPWTRKRPAKSDPDGARADGRLGDGRDDGKPLAPRQEDRAGSREVLYRVSVRLESDSDVSVT